MVQLPHEKNQNQILSERYLKKKDISICISVRKISQKERYLNMYLCQKDISISISVRKISQKVSLSER